MQYWYYISGIFCTATSGRLPRASRSSDIMVGKFQVTLNLALIALVLEAVIGVVARPVRGAAPRQGHRHAILASTLVLISVPTLVTGLRAAVVLGVKLKQSVGSTSSRSRACRRAEQLPAAGLRAGRDVDRLPHPAHPDELVETLRADYVRTATAKGLPRRRVVGRHALRNSLIPVVTFLGADLGALWAAR